MNYFSFFIRKILDSYRDTLKVINFYQMNQINNQIFVKIIFIKFFFSFQFLRNLQKIKKKTFNFKTYNIENKYYDFTQALFDLDKKGYSSLFKLDPNKVNDFNKLILNSKNHDSQKTSSVKINETFKKENETNENYIARMQKLNLSRITGSIDLNTENEISNFLLSDNILNLASRYLNTSKISISASYFISFPSLTTQNEKIMNAQYFHWDNDFTKFFKLYLYTSNVDNNSGPHVFVPYTHKKKLYKHQLQRSYKDSDIVNSYSNIKKFIGDPGTFFFVDSYGLHKGDVPRNNYRIILNVHYGKGKILYSKYDKFIILKS